LNPQSVSLATQQKLKSQDQQMESEALEPETLAELLKQRRAGRFVSASTMDDRISAMLARKRQAHDTQD
jgi:hypothetical protein